MYPYIVRWQPPYSTGEKDQPCNHLQEAVLMRDWFKSIGVPATIIRVTPTETVVEA
jgi:hypothetical protein